MERHIIHAAQSYWDDVYSRDSVLAAEPQHVHWLQTIQAEVQVEFSGRLLELGCGKGYDSGYLLQAGARVVGVDLSLNGLRHTAARFPTADFVQATFTDPLPFQSGCFDAAVAGLCLHYFLWQETLDILSEIRRVLGPAKLLVFRVNSVEDIAHGYGQGQEIEPRLFVQAEHRKRYFTEADCYAMFDVGWELLMLRPFLELRYGVEQPKPTWAGVARTR